MVVAVTSLPGRALTWSAVSSSMVTNWPAFFRVAEIFIAALAISVVITSPLVLPKWLRT